MGMQSLIVGGGLLAAAAMAYAALPVGTIGTTRPASPTSAELASRLFDKDQGETRAVLLLVDGKPVFRRYAPGYGDQTRFISWSMAKSVTGALVGALVADGKLQLDAPVPFAEWQKPGDPRRAITLRHLLTMSSGLAHREGLDPKRGPEDSVTSDTVTSLFLHGDTPMAARALAKPLEAPPGARYEYSSKTSLLLSELITRQLTDSKDPRVRAKAYSDFAQARLFGPAGVTSAVMEFDAAGTQVGGSIIYMTLDDWGRLGDLLIDGKGVDGTQAIAPEWIAFLRTPSATDNGYGGQFWLNRPRTGAEASAPVLFPGTGPDTVFAMAGHLGQWVIIAPEQRVVLVRLGRTNDGDLAPVRRAMGAVMAAATGTR